METIKSIQSNPLKLIEKSLSAMQYLNKFCKVNGKYKNTIYAIKNRYLQCLVDADIAIPYHFTTERTQECWYGSDCERDYCSFCEGEEIRYQTWSLVHIGDKSFHSKIKYNNSIEIQPHDPTQIVDYNDLEKYQNGYSYISNIKIVELAIAYLDRMRIILNNYPQRELTNNI